MSDPIQTGLVTQNMVEPDDDTPLGDARQWLRERVDKGEACPCCTQFAKIYKRRINSGMAVALIRMYRSVGLDFGHKPTILRGVGSAARDESLLRYWGLLEEEINIRPDGGRAGFWRVTDLGAQWIKEEIVVAKYAKIYDSRCLGFEGVGVTIRDALGTKFDYAELMSA